jgi:hypothetical protein
MNHKVPGAGTRASGQTNRITSLGTQNQVDFHEAIRVTSLCVSFYFVTRMFQPSLVFCLLDKQSRDPKPDVC